MDMRSSLAVVVAVVVLTVVVLPAVAQDLLEEPVYTVHFDAPLEDVIKQLKDDHSISLSADRVLQTTRVVLDLEGATWPELLEAICRQVGAVYDTWGGLHPGQQVQWQLREGDWDTDPRPRTEVGDYSLIVSTVSVTDTWHLGFKWGMPEPEGSDSHTLKVQFNITFASELAEMKLGAVRVTRAVCDTGEELEPPNATDEWEYQHYFRRMMPHWNGVLPLPPEGATTIAELHGLLGIHPEVAEYAVEFGLDEVGVAKAMGDAEATLLAWDAEAREISVQIDAPKSAASRRPADMNQGAEVKLFDADGKQVSVGGMRVSGEPGEQGHRRTVWKLRNIRGEPATVRVERIERSEPLIDVPFVIRDIPLP